MRTRRLAFLIVILSACLSVGAQDKSSQKMTAAGDTRVLSYSISFKEGEAVAGVGAAPVIKLPFECTGDGTAFITMVQPLGTGSRPTNLNAFSPSLLLISIAQSGEAHSFPLNQVPDLYDISEVDHFVADSNVIFLLRASPSDGGTAMNSASEPASSSRPERHPYIIRFDRDGTYKKTLQLGDDFEIYRIGLFPSGNYLAFGYDQVDHSPRLALLKSDGALLQYLDIPQGGMPQSVLGTRNGDGRGAAVYLAPVQFLGRGHSIYILQNKSDFPLLEVSEAGVIRKIPLILPDGVRVSMLIPSEHDLYARAEDQQNRIYEFNARSGALVRQFTVGSGQSGANLACINGDRFFSFEDKKGKMVPLVGTVEPISSEPSALR